jgi:hypothetical protein
MAQPREKDTKKKADRIKNYPMGPVKVDQATE